MEEEVILKLLGNISNIDFPAVVCLYLLFRLNKSLKDLTAAVNNFLASKNKKNKKETDNHG